MIVITLSKVPPSLRGDLTKWCQEIQAGVYVGNFSAKIRDLLWQRINKSMGSGSATMVYNTNNELGYQFRTTRSDYEVADFDGIPLMKHLIAAPTSTTNIKHGFSNAYKSHRAKIANKKKRVKNSLLDVVALDIETTGLDFDKDKIISIGAVRNNSELSKFYCLVKIKDKIPAKIVELTNINNELLNTKGIELSDALNNLIEFIGNSIIVGYNSQFDISFLTRACQEYKLPTIKNDVIDILDEVKKYDQFLDNYRLNTVLKKYGIENKNEHNSLDDAKATLKLFLKLNEKYGIVK